LVIGLTLNGPVLRAEETTHLPARFVYGMKIFSFSSGCKESEAFTLRTCICKIQFFPCRLALAATTLPIILINGVSFLLKGRPVHRHSTNAGSCTSFLICEPMLLLYNLRCMFCSPEKCRLQPVSTHLQPSSFVFYQRSENTPLPLIL